MPTHAHAHAPSPPPRHPNDQPSRGARAHRSHLGVHFPRRGLAPRHVSSLPWPRGARSIAARLHAHHPGAALRRPLRCLECAPRRHRRRRAVYASLSSRAPSQSHSRTRHARAQQPAAGRTRTRSQDAAALARVSAGGPHGTRRRTRTPPHLSLPRSSLPPRPARAARDPHAQLAVSTRLFFVDWLQGRAALPWPCAGRRGIAARLHAHAGAALRRPLRCLECAPPPPTPACCATLSSTRALALAQPHTAPAAGRARSQDAAALARVRRRAPRIDASLPRSSLAPARAARGRGRAASLGLWVLGSLGLALGPRTAVPGSQASARS